MLLFLIYSQLLGFFESGSSVPDSFLDSLRNYVIYSSKYDFTIEGMSLADLIISFHVRIADPVNPVLDLFPWGGGGGYSILTFLNRLVVSSGLSPLVAGGVR